MRIEFGDLRFDERTRKQIEDVLKNNWISEGPKVKEFEKKFGELFGYKHNISMSSGTSADMAACMALYEFGAKQGDEIIVPALAFIAPGNSIRAAGFTPKFVDVERETLNINPGLIEEKITPRTKAIMAVHTMGKPCKMDIIMDIAKKHGLYVIEDCCETHGARYKSKFVGNWGDMASFRFYAGDLICSAEGGMVSTTNLDMAEILRSVKSHGRKPGSLYFDHLRFGLNFKMNDVEAAFALPQVEDFWKTFNKRRENMYYLLGLVKDLETFAWFNSEDADETVCAHAFTVTLKEPGKCKELYEHLEKNSIECKRNFGSMPTQHKAFEYLGYKLGDFPEAEYVGNNGIHFGIHQYLSKEDFDYISDKLHEFFKKN